MENTIVALFLFLLIIGGVVWLQIFLSKKNNKWLGLLLPSISFIYSLMIVLSMSVFFSVQTVSETVEVDGVIISEETYEIESEEAGVLTTIGTILPAFLITNVPTFILVAIYYASRERLKIRNQLDKMNIQDLR